MPTQSEIARAWRTSRNYVHKCVHKRDCPTQSLEAANAWRDTYARQRPPTDVKQLQQLLDEDDDLPKGPVCRKKLLHNKFNEPRLPSGSLEYALHCARLAEEMASTLLREAIGEQRDSKIVARLAIYNKSLEGRLKAEKWYREEVEHRQNLIALEDARLLACKGLNIIISNLAALPEKVGPACNPQGPAQAIAVLKAECANIIADAKKSFPKEISEAIRWPEYPM
jgi:hypothetical protein